MEIPLDIILHYQNHSIINTNLIAVINFLPLILSVPKVPSLLRERSIRHDDLLVTGLAAVGWLSRRRGRLCGCRRTRSGLSEWTPPLPEKWEEIREKKVLEGIIMIVIIGKAIVLTATVFSSMYHYWHDVKHLFHKYNLLLILTLLKWVIPIFASPDFIV